MDHDDECPICLDNLNMFPIQILECKHKFHTKCVDELIRSNSNIVYCPLCRKNIYHHPPRNIETNIQEHTSLNLINITSDQLVTINNINMMHELEQNNYRTIFTVIYIMLYILFTTVIFYKIFELYMNSMTSYDYN